MISSPPPGYTQEIRDPQLIAYDDGYLLIVGAQTEQKQGSILTYYSKDLQNWQFLGTLGFTEEEMGFMIECPNLLFVNGKALLVFCPQGLSHEIHSYSNIYPNTYVIGQTFDFEKIFEYKEETTKQLVSGVEGLFKGNEVDQIAGKGTLLPDKKVKVVSEDGEQILEAEHIILAAGSKPLILPIPGMDLPGVLTSDELFRMKSVPESLTIIGGGVISVEFATVYAELGCKVTILEALPRILPNMDKEISQNLKLILKKRGIDIHTAAAVQGVEADGDQYICKYVEKEKEQSAASQYVLCAVGRCPNTDGLFAEDATPEMNRGRVVVNEKFETSIPGVYAIGDLIFGAQLAHAASAQGIQVVEQLAGKEVSVDVNVVPGCVYTDPEIASVGITEDEAKEKGIAVKVGKFIMSANGKSLITKEERGFIKIVAEEESGVIVGAQMMWCKSN